MEGPTPPEALKDFKMITAELNSKPLTIKTSSESYKICVSAPISPSISITPHLYSPSPPSSAFVSALQSPYISPRATEPTKQFAESTNTATATTTTTNTTPTTVTTNPSPVSFSGDEIQSTSCSTPSDRYGFSSVPVEQRPKVSDAAAPRISFSFQAPRVSNAKLRSCDVYIGFHGQSLNLIRFCKWLRSELELQGIASFVADRAKYSDSQGYEIADRIIYSAAYGIVVVTPSSFMNPLSVEEIRFFSQKKNLIPLLFNTKLSEINALFHGGMEVKGRRDAFEGLTRSANEFMLETNESNWRSCVLKAVARLRSKLARKNIAEKARETKAEDELPFPQNIFFVGREKELAEIEAAFFGKADPEIECPKPVMVIAGESSDGFADEESHDAVRHNGSKYICLEMRKCKEPTLEAWIDQPFKEHSSKGRGLQQQRSKHKKLRNEGKGNGNPSVVCISGIIGMGKTELALEFAHRYSQRYKTVLWVGGEAKYFRQNILNLSMRLGLDIGAEVEKDRGKSKSFNEQELDVFQQVKRELFRDVPFLLVIDNLEIEREWWEGKDLHDLIPRNTGATHVIITTRLSKVMNFNVIQIPSLALSDSLLLIGGRRKDYSDEDRRLLRNFDERLGRLSFGLWLVGSLLSELQLSPLALFEAIERISLGDIPLSFGDDDGFLQSNPFLMKTLAFCFSKLDKEAKGTKSLALRMMLSGAWIAPAPISSEVLAAIAATADKGRSFPSSFFCVHRCCCLPSQTSKTGTESALILVRLGLARRATIQPGCHIQFHPITQLFARKIGGVLPAKEAVLSMSAETSPAHLWASAFLLFGFKSEPPLVQLKAFDMVLFIKKIVIPLAIQSFMKFSSCNSAMELLEVSTGALEEAEKSFVLQVQDRGSQSLCWNRKSKGSQRVDEQVWQEVTLLKAALLETRAKLLLRGGEFDSGEELCRTCISIRTVMLGHNHGQTLAAQETLATLVRCRSRI